MVLKVSEIQKSYKRKQVLRGISFQAAPGSCIGIVGSNGCGKTTLLSVLAGVLRADSGRIWYDDADVTSDRRFYSSKVAYVPQENPIMEELTVKDNLKLWYKGYKDLERDTESEEPYVILGLESVLHTPAGKLSGGMKKRLSIACSLSNHAPILILDEPGAALDLACKADIRAYLKQYQKQGGMIILTSHELEELSLCDQMYVIKQGVLQPIETGLSAEQLIACWT